MFQNKKYITVKTLDKMHSEGRILAYSIRTLTYNQHIERVGEDGQVLLVYEPAVVIHIQTKDGNHIEMQAVKKKKTIRIMQLCINSIKIK